MRTFRRKMTSNGAIEGSGAVRFSCWNVMFSRSAGVTFQPVPEAVEGCACWWPGCPRFTWPCRARDRQQPRLDQVFLAWCEDDRGLPSDQPRDKGEVRCGQGHECTTFGKATEWVATRVVR